jgi:hypothetical protein
MVKDGEYGANIVYIYINGKKNMFWNYSRNGGEGGMMENGGGGAFKYNIFDIL